MHPKLRGNINITVRCKLKLWRGHASPKGILEQNPLPFPKKYLGEMFNEEMIEDTGSHQKYF